MGRLVKKRVFILVIFWQKILNREIYSHANGKWQTSTDLSWEFLKIENMQIKWKQLKAILMDKTKLKLTNFVDLFNSKGESTRSKGNTYSLGTNPRFAVNVTLNLSN